MYDFTIRYLCSAFVDAASIDANPKIMSGLLKVLKDEQLEAATVLEQTDSGNIPRILLRDNVRAWQIFFGSKRFDMTRLPSGPDKGKFEKFAAFCKHAGAILSTCLGYFQRNAHRLAAIQEGLLPEMPESQMDDIARRILNMPPTFARRVPFEWDWRCASVNERIFARTRERTNTIAKIQRVTGTITRKDSEGRSEEFDRIRLDLDINTIPTETAARFSGQHIKGFFNKAGSWHKDLGEEVCQFVYGAR